ncbi:HAMP domain-containing sensor histidine kinase [Undibacterium terreum]|uniref:HAMP domain-containing sensor histidine kinase n=1 Tax=Undibacterium terreum TaxID=1224302 RepID=UPI001E36731A|nr:HAMP domain-containing sensor histidine kinase [Undibacterium terreum]
MKKPWTQRLYVRIYLAMLASLAITALLFGIVTHIRSDPEQFASGLETFGEIASDVLPPATAPQDMQQAALNRWRAKVRADLALYSADGQKIASVGRPLPPREPEQSSSGWQPSHPTVFALKLPDERWLLARRIKPPHKPPLGLIGLLALIALIMAVGSYPIVRRLTRRLERLQNSVDTWGSGQLSTRVAVEGDDEVARLAVSFNQSAARIETLLHAQKSLLANASHELRSPLARIKLAVELMQSQPKDEMQQELSRNISELDQLIDEILLTSRLDAVQGGQDKREQVDLTAMLAEECARVNAQLDTELVTINADAKLIRRMLRNLLENAKRYGGNTQIDVSLNKPVNGFIQLDICDRGPGVPEAERERIFEPFYRVPGARESEGGVGLGLSLVRQIAARHGGKVDCLDRPGGGSCFRVSLPAEVAH